MTSPPQTRVAQFQKIARRIRVPLGFAFALFFIWRAHPNLRSLLLSIPIVIAGLALRAIASGNIKKNAELAVSGPYAFTRNPLYLGSLILALGFLIASRSWGATIFFLILFTVIYAPTILSEEAWLRSHFPEFDAYSRTVPRLIPRLTPARLHTQISSAAVAGSDSSPTFSPALYARHREYNALLGAAAMYAVLILKLFV
jgi:protein-S-isoprenylcysteine O-methyltransferase Ste14